MKATQGNNFCSRTPEALETRCLGHWRAWTANISSSQAPIGDPFVNQSCQGATSATVVPVAGCTCLNSPTAPTIASRANKDLLSGTGQWLNIKHEKNEAAQCDKVGTQQNGQATARYGARSCSSGRDPAGTGGITGQRFICQARIKNLSFR